MMVLAAFLSLAVLGLQAAASPMPKTTAKWPRVLLPHTSVGAASHAADRNANRDCSVASFAHVTDFILKEYQIDSVLDKTTNRTQLRGTIAVENPGTGDTYRLVGIPISTGGGVWSVCIAGRDAPLPAELERCQYVIERQFDRIGFRFQWFCDDKDPSHPYVLPIFFFFCSGLISQKC